MGGDGGGSGGDGSGQRGARLAGSRKRSVDGEEGEGEGVCGWTPRGLVTRVENEAEAEEERRRWR